MKNNRLDIAAAKSKAYKIFCWVMVLVLAFLFAFPLYWIITGSFKTPQEINSINPTWFPKEFVMRNYEKLMTKRSAPLFNFEIFGLSFTGPKIPGAVRWLINTVFMAVASMIITCGTSAMAGYVLAKKRFYGKTILFSLIVCAMALPKQVVLIPLVRLMSNMGLYDNIWAVIFPIVGWPFGVFLLKQFAEGIPTEMVEACRIDGASEWRTFTDVMFPMIKPGVGALAIFTFINSWNDYFMQLIMLTSTSNLTISLGIATMQGEVVVDYGLLMAGSALASIPIIIVFLIFQKYFTKGITMGAVKG
ncbi:MAG: carbohydrate ABC transporter permease [Oscillospiraceae bacterium]|nr:carbohydrate ABC transporter permease [Oscillospiraceae bacterium]